MKKFNLTAVIWKEGGAYVSNMKKMEANGKFRENEEAVSPVIGAILMVAITIILAALVGAFVFEIETPEPASTTALKIEGAVAGQDVFTITHIGGDVIMGAFNNTWQDGWGVEEWQNMEVRINGAVIGINAMPEGGKADLVNILDEFNGGQLPTGLTNINPGDVLKFDKVVNFDSGDVVTVIHVPSGQILREFTVL